MDGHSTALQVEAYRHSGFYYPLEIMTAGEAARHVASLEAIESSNGPMNYRVKPYLVMTSAWEIATLAPSSGSNTTDTRQCRVPAGNGTQETGSL